MTITDDPLLEGIKDRLRNAFKPLRCVVEEHDYRAQLRLKVFDCSGNGVIQMPCILLRNVRSDADLNRLIKEVRERLQAEGFSLS